MELPKEVTEAGIDWTHGVGVAAGAMMTGAGMLIYRLAGAWKTTRLGNLEVQQKAQDLRNTEMDHGIEVREKLLARMQIEWVRVTSEVDRLHARQVDSEAQIQQLRHDHEHCEEDRVAMAVRISSLEQRLAGNGSLSDGS